MEFPCTRSVKCPGSDSPISNWSSEDPDLLRFLTAKWPIYNANNPVGGTDGTGPWPTWIAAGCYGICSSNVDPLDVVLCAQRQAFICAHTRDDGSSPPFFFNSFQSCGWTCPDGTVFTWNVMPGSFVQLDQATADQMAQDYACKQAAGKHVCIGAFSSPCCVGQFYSSTVKLDGLAPIGVEVTSGSLPPGLGLSENFTGTTVTLSGLPTQIGFFTFTLAATDANGNFIVKTVTFGVMGITNSGTLTPPVVGTAYSQQLLADGGTAPFTFTLESGALPGGITMSSSGLLSGTPLISGTFTFSVLLTDAKGLHCSIPITLNVTAGCPFFDNLVWDAPPDTQISPHGTAIQSFPNAHSVQADMTCVLAGVGQPSILTNTNANVPLPTDPAEVTCTVRVTISNLLGANFERVFVSDSLFNVFYLDTGTVQLAAGVHTFSFTKPAGITAICVSYSVQCADGTIGVENAAVRMLVEFGV